jgi:hypothetical protein
VKLNARSHRAAPCVHEEGDGKYNRQEDLDGLTKTFYGIFLCVKCVSEGENDKCFSSEEWGRSMERAFLSVHLDE